MRRRDLLIGVAVTFVGGFVAVAILLQGALPLVCRAACEQGAAGPGQAPCGNGDTNGSGDMDIADVVYLLNYLFGGGDPPVALAGSQRQYLSIPAAALLPYDETIKYKHNGRWLRATDEAGSFSFYAPVIVPSPARITRLALDAYDAQGGEVGGYLQLKLRSYSHDAWSDIAELETSGPDAPGNVTLEVPLDTYVDPRVWSYGFTVTFNNHAAGDLRFYRVVIEYELE
jgi:hypothetical protein